MLIIWISCYINFSCHFQSITQLAQLMITCLVLWGEAYCHCAGCLRPNALACDSTQRTCAEWWLGTLPLYCQQQGPGPPSPTIQWKNNPQWPWYQPFTRVHWSDSIQACQTNVWWGLVSRTYYWIWGPQNLQWVSTVFHLNLITLDSNTVSEITTCNRKFSRFRTILMQSWFIFNA